MHDLLTLLTTLPVMPFAVGFALCVAYWLIALVSGLDFGSDSLDGAVDGAVDGALDGAADGAVDGAVDGAADGVADGALDAAADGAADGVTDGIGESWSMFAVLATFIPLGRVPLTVWASLFSWWGFVVSLGSSLLLHVLGLEGQIAAMLGAVVAAMLLSLPLANRTSAPLAPLFRTISGRARASLVGEVAEITTGRVDGRFGQARVLLGGDELVVHVRCDRPNNGLARGHSALIVEFDRERDAFIVEPMAHIHTERAPSRTGQTKPATAVQIDG